MEFFIHSYKDIKNNSFKEIINEIIKARMQVIQEIREDMKNADSEENETSGERSREDFEKL